MPTVPTTIRDAVPVIALAEKLSALGREKSSPTRKHGSNGRAAIAPGVQFFPYPGAVHPADTSTLH